MNKFISVCYKRKQAAIYIHKILHNDICQHYLMFESGKWYIWIDPYMVMDVRSNEKAKYIDRTVKEINISDETLFKILLKARPLTRDSLTGILDI